MKAIIVYYSFTGHTKEAAHLLALRMNCDIEEIKLTDDLCGTDREIDERTRKQVEKKETPEIYKIEKPLLTYDVILLGTPVWWLDIPPAVRSFLSQNNLSEKSLYAFVTNGGNTGTVSSTLKTLAPGLHEKHILYLNFDDGQLDLKDAVYEWISENFSVDQRHMSLE